MRNLALMALLLLSGCNEVEHDPGHTGSITPDNVPVDRAAKVSAVMAAEGITIGDVATFVQQYGYTVIPGTLPTAHWAPADRAVYYVATINVSVGDTMLVHYLPNRTSAAYSMTVVAYDEQGRQGSRSEVGWSNNGTGAGSLPGVGQ